MSITKPVQPVRDHIQPADIKCWARHWHVTDEQIRLTIEKTGNSVVAVTVRAHGLDYKPPMRPCASVPQSTEHHLFLHWG
jgi:Protein of unknown function (DUF3606)